MKLGVCFGEFKQFSSFTLKDNDQNKQLRRAAPTSKSDSILEDTNYMQAGAIPPQFHILLPNPNLQPMERVGEEKSTPYLLAPQKPAATSSTAKAHQDSPQELQGTRQPTAQKTSSRQAMSHVTTWPSKALEVFVEKWEQYRYWAKQKPKTNTSSCSSASLVQAPGPTAAWSAQLFNLQFTLHDFLA